MKCGIVGLPNAGKSTLFNSLTSGRASAENYPFCTIDPNVGVVEVPDTRIEKLQKLFQPEKTIYPAAHFVDIAGLIKGAHKGEGLGHQFLSHIRETKALLHVVRCFENKDTAHVYSSIDPCRDIEIVESELILADLDTLQNRLHKIEKPSSNNKEMKQELQVLKKILNFMNEGKKASLFKREPHESVFIERLFLLTDKPVLYVCNADDSSKTENTYIRQMKDRVGENTVFTLSGKLESELAQMPSDEKQQYLEALEIKEPALNRLIEKAYSLLNLITFFTAGKKEVRGWTVKKGSLAPQAAGVIHSDFEKGFIRAEVASFENLSRLGSIQALKEKGLYHLEGRKYVVKDGDILYFRFAV